MSGEEIFPFSPILCSVYKLCSFSHMYSWWQHSLCVLAYWKRWQGHWKNSSCVGYFSVCPSSRLAPFLKRPLSVAIFLFFVVFCPITFLFGFMPTLERFPKYAIQVKVPSLLRILCFDSQRVSVVSKYFKMLQHMNARQWKKQTVELTQGSLNKNRKRTKVNTFRCMNVIPF